MAGTLGKIGLSDLTVEDRMPSVPSSNQEQLVGFSSAMQELTTRDHQGTNKHRSRRVATHTT
eukprot:6475260-Amphidinium_carterae.1